MRAFPDRVVAAAAGMALTLAMTLGIVGCGGGEPGVTPVSGRVTYKGQPVTTGEVFFSPEHSGARGAQGKLDSSGNYTLGTFDARDGAYAGAYKVSIIAQGPDKPIPAKKVGKMLEEDMQGTGDPLIPRKYFNAETSGLKADVVAGKSNTFDFDLTD
jgi:hypothetical protein